MHAESNVPSKSTVFVFVKSSFTPTHRSKKLMSSMLIFELRKHLSCYLCTAGCSVHIQLLFAVHLTREHLQLCMYTHCSELRGCYVAEGSVQFGIEYIYIYMYIREFIWKANSDTTGPACTGMATSQPVLSHSSSL